MSKFNQTSFRSDGNIENSMLINHIPSINYYNQDNFTINTNNTNNKNFTKPQLPIPQYPEMLKILDLKRLKNMEIIDGSFETVNKNIIALIAEQYQNKLNCLKHIILQCEGFCKLIQKERLNLENTTLNMINEEKVKILDDLLKEIYFKYNFDSDTKENFSKDNNKLQNQIYEIELKFSKIMIKSLDFVKFEDIIRELDKKYELLEKEIKVRKYADKKNNEVNTRNSNKLILLNTTTNSQSNLTNHNKNIQDIQDNQDNYSNSDQYSQNNQNTQISQNNIKNEIPNDSVNTSKNKTNNNFVIFIIIIY